MYDHRAERNHRTNNHQTTVFQPQQQLDRQMEFHTRGRLVLGVRKQIGDLLGLFVGTPQIIRNQRQDSSHLVLFGHFHKALVQAGESQKA